MSKFFLIIPTFLLLSLSSCTGTQATQPQVVPVIPTISGENPQTTMLYVDVREDSEWDAGHVAGAIHVKLGGILAGNVSTIPKDQPVALYCHSGRRAGEALQALQKLGYSNVVNAGGIDSLQGVIIVQ